MRIVAGAWRGRTLVAPPGQGTRPTADRVRQALFDMLMHADWGGRQVIEGAVVLDVFAGTGALGLEALSRGAASACFIENDAAALKALRANIAACGAGERAVVVPGDVFTLLGDSRPVPEGRPPLALSSETKTSVPRGGSGIRRWRFEPASLVFLDPPYGENFVPRAVAGLTRSGVTAPDALFVAETARGDTWVPDQPLLAEREYGAARIVIFRTA